MKNINIDDLDFDNLDGLFGDDLNDIDFNHFKIDYQKQLNGIPIIEIETFLRKKKLEKIKNENT
jgi:hypothetical protein